MKKITDAQIYTLRRMLSGKKYQLRGDMSDAREIRFRDDVNAPSIRPLALAGLVEFADKKTKKDAKLYYSVSLTSDGVMVAKNGKVKKERSNGGSL